MCNAAGIRSSCDASLQGVAAAVAFSRNALLNRTTCYLLRAEYMLLRHESSMCGQLLLAIAPVVENDFPGRFFEREAGK